MQLGPGARGKGRKLRRKKRKKSMPKYKEGDPISPSGFVRLSENGRSGVIVHQVKGLCTWCGNKVPPRRSTWCSHLCVIKYRLTQPDVLRAEVARRDEHVCALCGVDAYDLRERMLVHEEAHSTSQTAEMLTKMGYPSNADTVRHLLCDRRTAWDMDHIEPVSQGGDPFALDNLRTLCYWCHKGETRKLVSGA